MTGRSCSMCSHRVFKLEFEAGGHRRHVADACKNNNIQLSSGARQLYAPMSLACELHRGKTRRAGHAARDNPALPSRCSAAKTQVPGCHASSQSPPSARSRGRGPPRDCLSAVTRRGYAPHGASFAAPNRRRAVDWGPPRGYAGTMAPPASNRRPHSPLRR